jgi:hypothetical protein
MDELAGANAAVEFDAVTIMFSSPKKDNYKHFLKLRLSTKLYMPVWDWDEIEECRRLLFSNVTEQEARDLFLRWGGVPRFVLEKAHVLSAQNGLEEALSTASLHDLIQTAGSLDMADSLCHRLMHFVVAHNYSLDHVMFASPFVRKSIIAGADADRRKAVLSFINDSQGFGALGALRGALFEEAAHEALSAGGDFRVRSLDDASATESMLHIPPSSTRWMFDKGLSDLQVGDASDYCRPVQKNFPVVDALRPCGELFQMTVSAQHDVNIPQLQNIVDAMADTDAYTLFFVVPDTAFPESFRMRLVQQPEGGVTARMGKVVYKLLSIPISGTLSMLQERLARTGSKRLRQQ